MNFFLHVPKRSTQVKRTYSLSRSVSVQPASSGLRFHLALLLLFFYFIGTSALGAVPAFPGAEGGGALSVGGRGGVVCEVTNLNDSGPGSLRACVEMEGPRTAVFRVGGTIELESVLYITNPFLTIAGQTAPGGGIQISGKKRQDTDNLVRINNTHDIIIRYVRFRNGEREETGTDASTLSMRGAHDVILDHVSLMWAEKTNFTVWDRGYSITLQNSIVAEPLNKAPSTHRVNINVGGNSDGNIKDMVDIDFHKNLLANSSHRNPLIKTHRNRFINNLVYNFRLSSESGGANFHDYIGNIYKWGPVPRRSRMRKEIAAFVYDEEICDGRLSIGTPSIYTSGNFGPYTADNNSNNVQRVHCENGNDLGDVPSNWWRSRPLDPVGLPITVYPYTDIEDIILPSVGPSHRLDCLGNWVFNRDDADARVVGNYVNDDGALIYGSEELVGGFPQLASGTPCTDTSGDGVPDEWAIKNGLDHTDASVGGRVHANGYTYLELYLSGMQLGGAPAAPPVNVRVE